MSNTRSAIARHTKRQENMIHKEEKNKSIESEPEMISVIKLVDKDIKAVIINNSFCSRS